MEGRPTSADSVAEGPMSLEQPHDLRFVPSVGSDNTAADRRVSFTVFGQLYSMKNSKIIGRFKHPKAKAFERDFALQVPPEAKRGLGSPAEPIRAIVTVFYPSRRQDLDCALVYDCLQTAGVVTNDRYIIEKHEFAEVDAANPRVEITVELI